MLACGRPADRRPAAGASLDRPAFAAKLDAAVQDAFAKREMPGGSVVVVQGNQVTYHRGFGFADLESKRPYTDSTPTVIGSTSKPLTALAVLRLVQLGKVALDTPIVRYVPEIKFADSRANTITLRHLLTNRSGIVLGFSGAAFRRPPIQDSMALERQAHEMARLPLLFAPGQGYKYSNRGWTLAGYVVQRVSGTPIEDYLRKEVFEPLGMTHTTLEFWKVPDLATGYGEGRTVRNHPELASLSREYGPSGMVVSTGADVGNLLVALLNDGKTVRGTQFLTPELIHEALRAQADAESELGGPTRYGLGWEIDSTFGTLTIKKAGSVGTMVSLWIMLPAQKTAVAFTFNREDYAIVPLAPNVLKVIAGGDAAPFPSVPPPPFTPPEAVKVSPAVIKRWLGTYDTRNGDVTVSQSGDSLVADFEGVTARLVPTSDSTYVAVLDDVKNAGKTFAFRSRNGKVTIWSGKDSLGTKY
jgi:CubicO group peptidase (beta-lactamase class C family)